MTTENKANIREYQIRAGLTDTFGRLICSSRHHHFVVDGPAQNGCPGEALTPPEIFLAGVITCGVELVQVFARDKNLSLRSATGIISAVLDRSNQARSDVTLFNSVRLDFTLTGVSPDVTVQVGYKKYRGTLDRLNFVENKPYLGSYRNGWLDLALSAKS